MQVLLTPDAWNDAGLLREYAAERFHSFLIYGGGGETYRRFCRVVGRISELAGIDPEQVITNLRDEAEAGCR